MAEDNMSNILNNVKNMLNNSNDSSSSNNLNNSSSSDFNITPEMISNLASIIQNSNNEKNSTSDSSVENDADKGTGNFGSNSSSQTNSFNNIDFETIFKIKSIIETLNKKDDPRSNLLYSLKPYLRENRQKKLDQYVNLFKITQVTNLFKNEKGAEN